jgi:multidrug efflux pump subunit AcrA (membrane-fusion protein)
VHIGERVEIRLDAYPDQVFSGRVALISDVVDPQTRTISVRSVLSNPAGRLRPEMFGEMIHEETFREVPVVPPGAVVQDESGSIVYREVETGVFERRRVKTGRPTSAGVPVLEGLTPGERIITEGAILLRTT